jgi:hypothetical protein
MPGRRARTTPTGTLNVAVSITGSWGISSSPSNPSITAAAASCGHPSSVPHDQAGSAYSNICSSQAVFTDGSYMCSNRGMSQVTCATGSWSDVLLRRHLARLPGAARSGRPGPRTPPAIRAGAAAPGPAAVKIIVTAGRANARQGLYRPRGWLTAGRSDGSSPRRSSQKAGYALDRLHARGEK